MLVDTGMHEPGSLAQLERALDQVNLRLEQVRLLVCTHAHSDHWGQAAPIVERAGCEFVMHPNHEHATRGLDDPEAALARRLEVGRQSGVPEAALAEYAEVAKGFPSGVARAIEPDRPLIDGVKIETDLGTWVAYETPGHAPSHVCLFQAERRVLISGDHVLGRISLYYEYGYSPDPVGEFIDSLDIVDALDARLALSGHGKPFVDVHGHIEGNRRLVAERLDAGRGRGRRRASHRGPDPAPGLRRDRERQQRLVVPVPDAVLPQAPGARGACPRPIPAMGRSDGWRCDRITLTRACQGWYAVLVRIDQVITEAEEPVFSFEFFPPKSDAGERVLGLALESLRQLDPAFVSVTYGAGGGSRGRTLELTKWIKQELGIEAMAHLSCVGSTREELAAILDDMHRAGIENILALRGDPPRGDTDWKPHPGGLSTPPSWPA